MKQTWKLWQAKKLFCSFRFYFWRTFFFSRRHQTLDGHLRTHWKTSICITQLHWKHATIAYTKWKAIRQFAVPVGRGKEKKRHFSFLNLSSCLFETRKGFGHDNCGYCRCSTLQTSISRFRRKWKKTLRINKIFILKKQSSCHEVNLMCVCVLYLDIDRSGVGNSFRVKHNYGDILNHVVVGRSSIWLLVVGYT